MSRKGITPVIAVVLLLLITVGAVASAWGLYQQVISDQSQLDDLNQRQRAQNTEISIQSVYRSNDGYVNVSLRNNGGEAVNLTRDVRLLTAPSGEFLPPSLLESNFDIGSPANSACFGGDGRVLTTSGNNRNLECNTSVQFPSAGDTTDFRIDYRNVDGIYWEFACTPSSSDSITCN